MSHTYDVFHILPVKCEDIENGGAGWYRFKWRPVYKHTWSIYALSDCRSWSCHFLGIRWYKCDAHNGWGRYWDGLHVEVGLAFVTIHFWIIWNLMCMADGPMDETPRRPLNLTGVTR